MIYSPPTRCPKKSTNLVPNRHFFRACSQVRSLIKNSKVFLGVVVLTGVLYKSNNESVEQLWSTLDGWHIFNRTMSRGRYQQILRFLRFDNAQSRGHHWSPNKLQPIREVFETWDSYLRDSYTCRPSVTVHEQLISYRGRCPFKQYISSKPGKCGIKL